MKLIPSLTRWLLGAVGACLALALQPQVGTADQPATSNPALTGEKAIQHLKATGQYDSLSAAITAARYAVKPTASRAPGSSRSDEAVAKSEIREPKSEACCYGGQPGARTVQHLHPRRTPVARPHRHGA